MAIAVLAQEAAPKIIDLILDQYDIKLEPFDTRSKLLEQGKWALENFYNNPYYINTMVEEDQTDKTQAARNNTPIEVDNTPIEVDFEEFAEAT